MATTPVIDESKRQVDRILQCIKSNAIDILNLSLDFDTNELKKQYRAISLLVHPDRCQQFIERATTATSLVNAANDMLNSDIGLQDWKNRITKCKEVVVAQKCKDLTNAKIAAAEKAGLTLSTEQLTITPDEVKNHTLFRDWVIQRINIDITDEEHRKRLAARRAEQELAKKQTEKEENQIIQSEQKALQEGWDSSRAQREASWKSFKNNKGHKLKTNAQLRSLLPTQKTSFASSFKEQFD